MKIPALPRLALTATLAALALVTLNRATPAAEAPTRVPAPALDNALAAGPLQTAVLAGGCFWGVQAVFEHVKGVTRVVAGYAGGDRASADYETVSSGTTGHAESVQITFDPAQVSFGQLLAIAFSVVEDPTQLNRQGPDSGTQYRSDVFYTDARQKEIATAYIAQLEAAHVFSRPIVTRVDPLKGFYPAEGYHQDYLVNHPTSFYIMVNDQPKVENFRRLFPAQYADRPVLAGATAAR
jgi:peptide-methionine (S)-S-oxide reductase